jgi:hypothetical protein
MKPLNPAEIVGIIATLIMLAVYHPARASEPISQALTEHHNGRTVLAQLSGALRWANGSVDVYHNPKGSPLPNGTAQAVIEYAAWSWQQRTGLDINFKGLTDETQIDGAIVIQWADQLHMMLQSNSLFSVGITAYRHYTTGQMVSARVVLLDKEWREDWRHAAHTIMHEMGHAIGINKHSDDKAAIMYPYRQPGGRYALTAADAMLADYDRHVCHAELTPHGDVYIPNIIGHGVTLRREGDFFRLDHDHQTGDSCSGSYDGRLATIREIRGIDQGYKDVVLRLRGDVFEVVSFYNN